MIVYAGLLAEESGHMPAVHLCKADDTVQKMLQRALQSRRMVIAENELQTMADISHALDVW